MKGSLKEHNAKNDSLLRIETFKNHTLSGGTYLCSPFLGVPSPRGCVVRPGFEGLWQAKSRFLNLFMVENGLRQLIWYNQTSMQLIHANIAMLQCILYSRQEPITLNLQLQYLAYETAFSQISLFLASFCSMFPAKVEAPSSMCAHL